MFLSITLCNRLWLVRSDLLRLEIFLKWKIAVNCDVGKIYALRKFRFFPDVDFAVLIITDKIHLYIPAVCNLYSIEMPINNVASNLEQAC